MLDREKKITGRLENRKRGVKFGKV